MYKAIKNIGDYKVGDEVPIEMAELWLKMYDFAHVEKVDTIEPKKKKVVKKRKAKVEVNSPNFMLEDYLARNKNVVKRNIKKDGLSKEQLDNLLILETADKNRPEVIKAIEDKLEV